MHPLISPPNKYQNIIKIIISISSDKLDLLFSIFISPYDNCSDNYESEL